MLLGAQTPRRHPLGGQALGGAEARENLLNIVQKRHLQPAEVKGRRSAAAACLCMAETQGSCIMHKSETTNHKDNSVDLVYL